MKFSEKICLKIILKVTKNQGFNLSLGDTFFKKPQSVCVCVWGGGEGGGVKFISPLPAGLRLSTPIQGKSIKISFRLNELINKVNSKPAKLNGKKSLRLQVRWMREDSDGNREIVKQVHSG